MVEIRAFKPQSKMNSDHTHSSEIWSFFRGGSTFQKGLGGCGFVDPKAVWLVQQ